MDSVSKSDFDAFAAALPSGVPQHATGYNSAIHPKFLAEIC